jgi:hypothetical protein
MGAQMQAVQQLTGKSARMCNRICSGASQWWRGMVVMVV